MFKSYVDDEEINMFAFLYKHDRFWFIYLIYCVFKATFSNISAIPWRPVLVVEEAGVPGENHRPSANNCNEEGYDLSQELS
jgi:hypothetical protein